MSTAGFAATLFFLYIASLGLLLGFAPESKVQRVERRLEGTALAGFATAARNHGTSVAEGVAHAAFVANDMRRAAQERLLQQQRLDELSRQVDLLRRASMAGPVRPWTYWVLFVVFVVSCQCLRAGYRRWRNRRLSRMRADRRQGFMQRNGLRLQVRNLSHLVAIAIEVAQDAEEAQTKEDSSVARFAYDVVEDLLGQGIDAQEEAVSDTERAQLRARIAQTRCSPSELIRQLAPPRKSEEGPEPRGPVWELHSVQQPEPVALAAPLPTGQVSVPLEEGPPFMARVGRSKGKGKNKGRARVARIAHAKRKARSTHGKEQLSNRYSNWLQAYHDIADPSGALGAIMEDSAKAVASSMANIAALQSVLDACVADLAAIMERAEVVETMDFGDIYAAAPAGNWADDEVTYRVRDHIEQRMVEELEADSARLQRAIRHEWDNIRSVEKMLDDTIPVVLPRDWHARFFEEVEDESDGEYEDQYDMANAGHINAARYRGQEGPRIGPDYCTCMRCDEVYRRARRYFVTDAGVQVEVCSQCAHELEAAGQVASLHLRRVRELTRRMEGPPLMAGSSSMPSSSREEARVTSERRLADLRSFAFSQSDLVEKDLILEEEVAEWASVGIPGLECYSSRVSQAHPIVVRHPVSGHWMKLSSKGEFRRWLVVCAVETLKQKRLLLEARQRRTALAVPAKRSEEGVEPNKRPDTVIDIPCEAGCCREAAPSPPTRGIQVVVDGPGGPAHQDFLVPTGLLCRELSVELGVRLAGSENRTFAQELREFELLQQMKRKLDDAASERLARQLTAGGSAPRGKTPEPARKEKEPGVAVRPPAEEGNRRQRRRHRSSSRGSRSVSQSMAPKTAAPAKGQKKTHAVQEMTLAGSSPAPVGSLVRATLVSDASVFAQGVIMWHTGNQAIARFPAHTVSTPGWRGDVCYQFVGGRFTLPWEASPHKDDGPQDATFVWLPWKEEMEVASKRHISSELRGPAVLLRLTAEGRPVVLAGEVNGADRNGLITHTMSTDRGDCSCPVFLRDGHLVGFHRYGTSKFGQLMPVVDVGAPSRPQALNLRKGLAKA